MKKTILPTSLLVLVSLASAQQGGMGQSGQQRQMTPEMQARMKQMQPIMDLAQGIRLLPDLEKNKATAMTRAQAAQLLPILKALQTAQALDPNNARKYLSQIEDKILTDRQLTAMDDLALKEEKERAARRAQAQKSGQTNTRIPGVPGGMLGGQNGAGQNNQNGSRNAQGQAGQGSRSGQFNPFKQGRQADALKAYIAVLQKK